MKRSIPLFLVVAGFTAAAALPVRAQIPQIQYQAEDALSGFPDDIHLGEAAGVARAVPDAAALAAALIANAGTDPARIAAFTAAHSDATAKTLAAIPQLLAAVRPS